MAGVYSSGVRFAAGGAAGVHFNGVRFARPIGKIAIAMDYAHLGLSSDIYMSASPTWTNLRTLTPALDAAITAGASFQNVALSITGECWILTYGGASSDNGLWYCADVSVASPTFSLIYTNAQALADTGAVLANLGCSDLGMAYCATDQLMSDKYLWGKNTMTVAIGDLPCGRGQRTICSGASVRIGIGAGGVPKWGIRELIDGVSSWKWWWLTGSDYPSHVAIGFFIWSGYLDSYVDFGAPTLIYSGAHRFLAVDGTSAVTLRASDGMLMIGATPLATALDAFGIAGRAFGDCCIGPAGYGELLVCAEDAHASNFFALRSIGGVWTVKDGDWVAKTGGWVGVGHSTPMIVTANLGGGTGVYFNATRMENG